MDRARHEPGPSTAKSEARPIDAYPVKVGFDDAVQIMRARNDELVREARGLVTRGYGRQRRAMQSFMDFAGRLQHEGFTPQVGAAWLSWSRSNVELMLDQVTEQMSLASKAAQCWVDAISVMHPASDRPVEQGEEPDRAPVRRRAQAPQSAEHDARVRIEGAA